MSVTARGVIVRGKQRYRVNIPPSNTGDKWRQKWFTSKEKAEAFAVRINADRRGRVEEIYALDHQTQTLLVLALKKAGTGQAVLGAVEAAIADAPKLLKPLGEAVDEFLKDREKSGRAPKYLRELRWLLHHLQRTISDLPCSGITTDHVRQWLSKRGSPASRQGCLRKIRTFFEFCRAAGWVGSNPVSSISMPSSENKPPGILTPAECKALLKSCMKHDPKLARYFALCLFGGLRPTEARQITKNEIHANHVEVSGAKAKTRRRRLVTINKTLRAWLKVGGDFHPRNFPERFQKVVRGSGVKWTQDCMRHSFVSYHYALHSAKETSNEAGHSESVLFLHYRALVTKKQAEEFFQLTPDKVISANVV